MVEAAAPGSDHDGGDGHRRARFSSHELAIVLSHYDLGVVRSIREYPRGSRRSPKVRIKSDRGEYLLKRRAPGRDRPSRVAFTHDVQLHLADHRFPVPRLIGTRFDNNSMLQTHGRVYEMFEFVRGTHFRGSRRQAQFAGFVLSRLHRLLSEGGFEGEIPRGSYHRAPGLAERFREAAGAVTLAEPGADKRAIRALLRRLEEASTEAGRRVERAGFAAWTPWLVHGDWHPGNLLYEDHRVNAVLDFDSARLEPRVADVANGALQFSVRIMPESDPRSWPARLEVDCLRAFLVGYHQGGAPALSSGELEALPWLMIEAIVAESIVPIAATGRFARFSGTSFLDLVDRKVRWLVPRTERLVAFVRESLDAA